MGLKGFSESLAARGIQADLKVIAAASAGTLYMLESGAAYVVLASNAVSHVLDYNVTADGVLAADVIMGVEVKETKVNEQARLRPLAPGDLIRTDQLQSTGTGGIDGTTAYGAALGVNPASGKLRAKQATDDLIARVSPENEGNTFDTDGYIWAAIVALD